MKTLNFEFITLIALAAASAGCALDATPDASDDGAVSAQQALAAHVPVCTKIGSHREGWRWADTGCLIRRAKCADQTPQCQYVGENAEGWYADGLIAWADCSDIARVNAVGEACGPSIGYACDSARAYCQGLPEDGRGGTGICEPFGSCAVVADCSLTDNVWSHVDVTGTSDCVLGACTWVPEDCRTSADCQAGRTCVGIPSDGSTHYGKCRATGSLPGAGAVCSEQELCEAELACVGLSMGPEGQCSPAWMVADYTNSTTYGTTSNVIAYGLATVPVDIVVTAQLNKTNSSKWTLQLTDPNGVAAVVCSPTTEPCTAPLLADGVSVQGNSRDDQVNGRWTLQVKGSRSPKIRSWTLHLSSRWD